MTAADPTVAGSRAHCRDVTLRSGTSFRFAFPFLPPERRHALHAIYAFCRLVDDAADDAPSPRAALQALEGWRRELDAVFGNGAPREAITPALREAVTRFPIQRRDMEAVIEGCEWDANRHRYESWAELRGYCYRVASAVGLMCIEIFGYTSPRARDYAVDLGLALQLTNILRDVIEDGGRGRVYLPQEDLALFAVDEADLLAGRRTPAVRRLLRYEADRARTLYLRARALISERERSQLVVAEIMGDIYFDLLERLERSDFAPSTRVPKPTKLALALKRFVLAQLARP